MKKFLAVLAIAGVMTSCKDKKADEPKPVDASTTTTTTATTTEPATPPTTTTTASGEIPKFADADVQKYVEDYTAYVTSLVAAYKSKDMAKAMDLSKSSLDWSTRSTELVKKLTNNPEEAAKFSSYMSKLGQELSQAMTAK